MPITKDTLSTPIKPQTPRFEGTSSGTQVKNEDSSFDSLFETTCDKSSSADEYVKIDGKIDTTMQGFVNDCGTLSGLNALSYSEAGSKAIKEAISQDENGVITVKFKAVNLQYTITPEEMSKLDASFGDGDTRAFEIALRKYRQDIRDGKVVQDKNLPEILYEEGIFDDPLGGGSGEQIVSLLTGKESKKFINKLLKLSFSDEGKKRKEEFNSFLEDFEKNPGNYAVTINFQRINEDKGITTFHEYAIKKIDGDNVILTNPWNSGEETAISKEEFLSSFMSMTATKLDQNENFFDKVGNFFKGLFN